MECGKLPNNPRTTVTGGITRLPSPMFPQKSSEIRESYSSVIGIV